MEKNMKETPDFIGVYPGAFTEDFCERLMKHFDFVRNNTTYIRSREVEGHDPLNIDDHFMYLNDWNLNEIKELGFINKEFAQEFYGTIDRYYPQYRDKYSVLKRINTDYGPGSGIFDLKVQKTETGEGFHAWHCESFDRGTMFRYLTYTVYLNTINEGGETEFLYQKRRLKPEQGTLVIFPTAWTHVHRGNPPLDKAKYIITTWEEYVK